VLAGAKVVSVGLLRTVSDLQPLDFDNFFLFNDKLYTAAQAYKNSRAANLLFSYELARRTQDSGVKVYAICPGIFADGFCTLSVTGMVSKITLTFTKL